MTPKFHSQLTAALLIACLAVTAHASDQAQETVHTSIIALSTDDFELTETDISDLAVGESRSIVTDSGKNIDLLRTEDGVEIYVDGELLEMNMMSDAASHGDHAGLHKKIEIVCTCADDCEEMIWISEAEDAEVTTSGEGVTKIIKREIVIECDEEEDCARQHVLIKETGEGDLSMEDAEDGLHLIRLHGSEEEMLDEAGDKVIVIKKKVQRN